MKRYIFVAIFSFLLIVWIAFIWYNSMQPIDQSLQISTEVADGLNAVAHKVVDALPKKPVTTAPVTTTPVTTTPADQAPETTEQVTTVPVTTEEVTTEEVTTEEVTTEEVTTEPIIELKVIRKGAHFFEYMILGVIAAVDIVAIFKAISRRRSPVVSLFMPLSVALGFGVAAIDELVIQAATDGRGPSWRDIGIDCGGAATGAFICILIFLITYYFSQSRQDEVNSQT